MYIDTLIGSVLTAASNTFDIANTWTEDSGNSNLKRVEKTVVQATGMAASAVVGSNTVKIGALSIFAEPETGGLSTWGVAGAAGIDIGAAAIINHYQEKLYNNLGIK